MSDPRIPMPAREWMRLVECSREHYECYEVMMAILETNDELAKDAILAMNNLRSAAIALRRAAVDYTRALDKQTEELRKRKG
jgi:hypothetical protein